jgi:hypothetical protein
MKENEKINRSLKRRKKADIVGWKRREVGKGR